MFHLFLGPPEVPGPNVILGLGFLIYFSILRWVWFLFWVFCFLHIDFTGLWAAASWPFWERRMHCDIAVRRLSVVTAASLAPRWTTAHRDLLNGVCPTHSWIISLAGPWSFHLSVCQSVGKQWFNPAHSMALFTPLCQILFEGKFSPQNAIA